MKYSYNERARKIRESCIRVLNLKPSFKGTGRLCVIRGSGRSHNVFIKDDSMKDQILWYGEESLLSYSSGRYSICQLSGKVASLEYITRVGGRIFASECS